MKKLLMVVAIAVPTLMIGSSPAQAQLGRFTCGLYLRQHFGLGSQYNLARNWLNLPRCSLRSGSVVVQRRAGRALGGGPGGHVSRVVRVLSNCRAVVNDNRGTYTRDVCKNLWAYVCP